MLELPAPLTSDYSGPILCYYVNFTSQIQIARVPKPTGDAFERVVFPGERLMFEAPPEACLEVFTSTSFKGDRPEQISCQSLRVSEVTRKDPITTVDIDEGDL